ncbi:OHCU decarboxylase [Elstera cyanobacteriorum]|uniref:2-oxo-4-hydroxy-4-carboxy-5-ureidoimidazoline decarboxylase n=1 Tax=Elstera cyanobacteriorum TaxID=2022747 RepID=A0A255XT11_9PROT|nr:2-oxo-4-hydroxy-4-carboxy-5-ureidoimidazoline decarboxylase [Elstera cyanobacteriorum]OYQ20147.1 OHCU decarboxylase [Elstera cyanobacteriorum]GFZ81437.1 OHCU decarboxylase [Elstera cyanobacteriorum]
MISLTDLNSAPTADFIAAVGGVFEHSPWVAEAVADQRPFADRAALHAAMVAAVDAATAAQKLALLRAHPDLAGKLAQAGRLTEASTAEQASAGLDMLTEAEFQRFTAFNTAYTERFGFPFIIAVRENTKASILKAFEKRIMNSRDQEFTTALAEVAKIAKLRLATLLGD